MNAKQLLEKLQKAEKEGKDLKKYRVCFDTEAQEFNCHIIDIDNGYLEDYTELVNYDMKTLMLSQNSHGDIFGIKEVVELKKLLIEALNIVDFYGDPDTYHAIAFIPDRPCGDLMEDFSEDELTSLYNRPMPGKEAREFYKKNIDILKKLKIIIEEKE